MIARLASHFVVLLTAWVASAAIAAGAGPMISFANNSGDAALVKLVGPSSNVIEVPNGSTRSVQVRGGQYYILVRYGTAGEYRYTRGDPYLRHGNRNWGWLSLFRHNNHAPQSDERQLRLPSEFGWRVRNSMKDGEFGRSLGSERRVGHVPVRTESLRLTSGA
jgi:hypothetical protein